MKREIRERRKRGIVEVSEDRWAGGESGGVTCVAAGGIELGLPVECRSAKREALRNSVGRLTAEIALRGRRIGEHEE